MDSRIFREYDIRGIVNKEFSIEESFQIARGIITYFKQENPRIDTIVIGTDGRTHAEPIKKQAILAATEAGINVIDIGICPTPTFYFALHTTETTSGFIITASHNPKEYNGMKICFNTKSVWGKEIRKIKEICETQNFYKNKTKQLGTVKKYNAIDEYITWLSKHFSHLKNLSVNAVIDCGNGTAGTIFPKLISKMNWTNVELLFEKVDGTFPNHEADPTTHKNMVDVKNHLSKNSTLDFGLGLDGDCDRMNPMTKKGFLIPGDQLLAVYAKQVLVDFPGAPIVFDIKASQGLIDILKKWGAKDCISPSGHSIIKDRMLKNNAKLAGELSCHFFFNDRYFGYDDGIYATLRLFEILNETKQTLEQLLKVFPKKISSPEIRISCKEENKTKIVEDAKIFFAAKKDIESITIDGIRAKTNYGWGLVRASNTQPAITIRFEADNNENLKKIKNDFFKVLKPHFNEKELKEKIGILDLD